MPLIRHATLRRAPCCARRLHYYRFSQRRGSTRSAAAADERVAATLLLLRYATLSLRPPCHDRHAAFFHIGIGAAIDAHAESGAMCGASA